MTTDKLPPLPANIEKMSKEALWDWFQRSTRAAGELYRSRQRYFATSTGLHSSVCRDGSMPDVYETIEMQRKKIEGLTMQITQMTRGYRKALDKQKRKHEAELAKVIAELSK